MIINHNIAALNTYRQLSAANTAQSSSMEKLSSGMRINRAGDDAAGLAISEKMRGQIRGLDMASKNAQDATSLIQTAEGALNETHSILQRMRELAVQASNDTNTADDRNEIQKEIDQLTEEVDRIANTTEFNTKKLLTGEIGTSVDKANVVSNISQTADTKAGTYKVTVASVATAATTGDLLGAKETNTAAAGSFTINVNGRQTVVAWEANESYKDLAARINSNVSGVKATYTEGSTKNSFTIDTIDVGADQSIIVTAGADGTFKSDDELNKTAVTGTGANAKVSGADAGNNNLTVSVSGNKVMLSGKGSDGLTFEAKKADSVNITVGGALNMQIGANENQTMSVTINSMDSENLGISNIDVTSTTGAESAITTIDNAIKSVSAERSRLGAYQNRLEHTINNLGTSSENLTAAESRIRDVDMAKEMMTQTKNAILAQAAQAMLAQANQIPQQVLQLLQ